VPSQSSDKSVRYSGSREIRVRQQNHGYPTAPPIFLARAFRLGAARIYRLSAPAPTARRSADGNPGSRCHAATRPSRNQRAGRGGGTASHIAATERASARLQGREAGGGARAGDDIAA
jgi:hypothetical protein